MPLTKFDDIAALVVIDMQKGIVALPSVYPAEQIARIASLARAFRAKNLPVVLVNVAGGAPGRTDTKFNLPLAPDFAELIPDLDRQQSDYTVTKLQIGAFYGTALEQILRRRSVTQIFVVGIATGSGVEATARTAFDHGYNVVTVVDAMADRNEAAHLHSIDVTFPRISEVTTTDEVLRALQATT